MLELTDYISNKAYMRRNLMRRKVFSLLATIAFLGSFMMILFGLVLVITHWWEIGGLIGMIIAAIGALSISFWSWFFKKLKDKYI